MKKNIITRKTAIVGGTLFLSVLSAFWMLSRTSLNEHECFVSVTAREMLESGDWILPTCNGQLRLQKIPLSYWMVAGLAGLTGKVDELTARLPSAAFAVLSVVAVLYFLSQWLSLRVAALSAAVWTTSLAYIRYSHNARPEMSLTFFIMLCFLSFYTAVNTGSRKKQIIYILVFWVSFGLANLVKGPAPLPLVLLPLFLYVVIFKKWKILLSYWNVTGILIFLVIILPWPVTVAERVNWDLTIWKKEFVDRLFGKYDPGHKPIYYYLYDMFIFISPWVAFLPMALAAPFYKIWQKKLPVMQFCWIWFVVDLLFLTASGGKRQHYILPLMPAMAILIGILLEDMAFSRRAYSPNFVKRTLQSHIVAISGVTIAALIYIALRKPQFLPGAIILSIEAIVMTIIAAVFFAAGKPSVACGMCFACIIGWFMIFTLTFSDVLDINREARYFAQKTDQIVPHSDKLVAYEDISIRFVQYFGKVVPVVKDVSTLHEHYQQGEWIVATSEHLKDLKNDKSVRKVYYQQRKKGLKEDTSGALFHITAPIVKYSEITDK